MNNDLSNGSSYKCSLKFFLQSRYKNFSLAILQYKIFKCLKDDAFIFFNVNFSLTFLVEMRNNL